MPFRLGLPELIIILVIVLLIFGVGRIGQIGGALGRSIKEFRKEASAKPEDEKKDTEAKKDGEKAGSPSEKK